MENRIFKFRPCPNSSLLKSAWIHGVVGVLIGVFIWMARHPDSDQVEIEVWSEKKKPMKVSVPRIPRQAHLKSEHQSFQKLDASSGVSESSGVAETQNSQENTQMAVFLSLLQERVNESKVYPKMSALAHEEGRVEIEIRIAGGGVKSIQIFQASKFERLNEAALLAVRTIPDFPSPPTLEEIVVHIPVVFELH